ncbi:MAG: mechanosensitive ion channel [Candidatus Eisenbacteria bacterium]|nr:mechanosensitive ion channel [Candidatus Eisenbacteria bacterium]
MENVIDTLMGFATNYGIKIVGAILVLVAGWIVAKWARSIVRKVLGRRNTDPAIQNFVASLTYYLIIVFTVISALGNFGVETASLVAVLGAAGFAIGFAMQGSLANFAAGVMLLAFRPYRIGDYVEVAGVSGTVKEMALFTTVLHTPDNVKIIVPNGKVFGDTIKNVTAEDTRRIDLVLGIGYGSSIEKTVQVVSEILKNESRILPEPAFQIAVSELADSSVNLVVRPWVKASDYWGVRFDLMRRFKEACDREGIEIPFPQRVVHMVSPES